MTRTCRVTLWPDRELVVDEIEYQGLLKQGLILPDPEPEQDSEDEQDKQDAPDEPTPPPATEPAPTPTSRPDKARRATQDGKD